VPEDDELTALREENDDLAEFLHMMQREYNQLLADFAAVLRAMGGEARVTVTAYQPMQDRIERDDDLATGTVTFRLRGGNLPTPIGIKIRNHATTACNNWQVLGCFRRGLTRPPAAKQWAIPASTSASRSALSNTQAR
jgi:hypothetical protein